MSSFKIPFPVDDTIDLHILAGYPEGSRADVILNPSKAFVAAWDATFEAANILERKKARALADGDARALEAIDAKLEEARRQADEERYKLVPTIVRGITLIDQDGKEHAFPFKTADNVRTFDNEIDYRLLDAVIAEVWVRGREGVLAGRRSFRNSRERGAEGAKPAGPTGAGS